MMLRRSIQIFLILLKLWVVGSTVGCASPKPWQREVFAKPQMSESEDEPSTRLRTHVNRDHSKIEARPPHPRDMAEWTAATAVAGVLHERLAEL